MKFGIFFELQNPRPWDEDSEYRLFHNALEQAVLADRLGFDCIWVTEHHFMEEYAHASAPEVFLGALSSRTKNIRLGHGIIQLTTNHPANVAERVATLDLLSDGRVELGLGEGGSVTELHPFGRRFRDKREVFDEAVQALIPMLSDSPYGSEFHGKFFDFPLRTVIPKPRQKPHPPLWVACSQYKTIERAGSLGMGALGFQFLSVEAAVAWVHAYYRAFVNHPQKLADYQTNPNIAMVSALMCSTSEEEARRRAEGWSFFQFALVYYNKEGPIAPGTVNLWDKYLESKNDPDGQQFYSDGLIGTPDQIMGQLDEFANAHVDQVILLTQAGKNTHEDICESLELFARDVMPEFHGREPDQQAWKAKVLSGELELEAIDTTPFQNVTSQTPVTDSPKK